MKEVDRVAIREITSGFFMLCLFFRQESCQSHNVSIDFLLRHRNGLAIDVSHDMKCARLWLLQRRGLRVAEEQVSASNYKGSKYGDAMMKPLGAHISILSHSDTGSHFGSLLATVLSSAPAIVTLPLIIIPQPP